MTEITGFTGPTRRAGELGVHSADSFTVAVPDLAVAAGFYGAFGLDVREEEVGRSCMGSMAATIT